MHADIPKAANGDFSAKERGWVLAAFDDPQIAPPWSTEGRLAAKVLMSETVSSGLFYVSNNLI